MCSMRRCHQSDLSNYGLESIGIRNLSRLTNLLSLTLASNHLATLPCNLSMALHAMPRITIGSTR